MTSEFDELQELILENARKVYSETVIDHFTNPRNVGGMADVDSFARTNGPCGDTMRPSGSKYIEDRGKGLPCP